MTVGSRLSATTNGHAEHPFVVADSGQGAASLPSQVRSTHMGPCLGDDAYCGLFGDYAIAAAEDTEADPACVLLQGMAGFGAQVADRYGNAPYVKAGNTRHAPRLFFVAVGPTAARKGTAWDVASAPILTAEPSFSTRIMGGFGSGEAFIDAVRDPDDEGNHGAGDRRVLVLETEFAKPLAVAGRSGSTLGPNIRAAWDGTPLESRTRTHGHVRASTHHIGCNAHITPDELEMSLTSTDIYGGTGNRFLYGWTARQKLKPEGGNVPDELIEQTSKALRIALDNARKLGEIRRTADAESRWRVVYYMLHEKEPEGIVGALTSRAGPQVLRLSLAFALADSSPIIDVRHIDAALAVWQFNVATVQRVFGDKTGDVVADRILGHVRTSAVAVDRTTIHGLFSNHQPKDRIDAALRKLVERHYIDEDVEDTGGRPRKTYREHVNATDR